MPILRRVAVLLALAACVHPAECVAQSSNTLRAFGGAAYGLSAQQLAVVINENDPASVEVGLYYARARGVPAQNIVRLRLPAGERQLGAEQFAAFRAALEAQLSADIQALLLVWTTPYAVECNSITGALALGFDGALCSHSCEPSTRSPYFDSASLRPYSDYAMRIAMLLPVESVAAAKALIDRGVAADRSMPRATAYLLTTSDSARNSRAVFFPKDTRLLRPPLAIRNLNAESLEYASDVMFYLTGRVSVDKLDTLRFLPGALADHLTSTGGDLSGSSQMSSLRWLEAGATASYGTVSEPCNHWQKFPNPAALIKHYALGATAIEAYWKSVAWPTQGLFIGEPLAAPYRR
jgi:uncharacterized protein (TIGR03790 family)